MLSFRCMKYITFTLILTVLVLGGQTIVQAQNVSASLEIRHNFEKTTGIKWIDASREEQLKYISEYNQTTKEKQNEKTQKKVEQDRAREEYKRNFQRKKEESANRLEERNRQREELNRQRAQKKEAQLRKMEESKRKMAEMRARSKSRR